MSQSITKQTEWLVRPVKAEISLDIRPLHCTLKGKPRNQGFMLIVKTDQTGQLPRLSLHWAHQSFCWIFHAPAQIAFKKIYHLSGKSCFSCGSDFFIIILPYIMFSN